MEFITHFTVRPLLFVLALGVLVFLSFRVVHFLIVRLLKNERLQNKLLVQLPTLERVTWPLYGLLFLLALVRPNPIWGTLLAVLLIAFSWNFLQNYFAGTFFILSGNYKLGQHVKTGLIQGKIDEFQATRCQIEQDNGEFLSVPYSKLVREVIIKTSPSEKILKNSIEIKVNKPCNFAQEKERLMQLLLSQPWLIPGSVPVFDVVEETKDYFHVTISIQVIHAKHLQLVEKAIQR